ncbi:MAG: hypothetical protein MI974_11065 [Chitinophagales bacterium]|nr:hypothetical protein [Chitinophagales bacterium]
MNNSRLWEVFSRLTPLERKNFGRWVHSPFFNRNKRLLLLFEYVNNCVANHINPDEEHVRLHVFSKEKAISDSKIRLAISELYSLLKEFLIYLEWSDKEATSTLALAQAFRKRGLERQYRKAIARAKTVQEKQPHRHAEYLDGLSNIAYEAYQEQSAGQRVTDFNLQELSNLADTAYIARKLRLTCIALSHQTVYRTDYDLGMLEAVLAEVRRRKLEDVPAIGLYYYGYLLIVEPEEESHFIRMKEMMLSNSSKLPQKEQRNLYLMALNYCIKQVNALKERFYQEVLDLYKFALNQGLLFDNGVLSPFAFNNIVAIALKVGEVDWSEQFVNTYAPKLERKYRNSIASLGLAKVEYVRKDYNQALLHLQQADYRDRINNLISKVLQVKIFYELGEHDVVEALLNALSTHIRRQRVMGYHRTNYLNIVRYTRLLLYLNPNDDMDRKQLRQRILDEKVLTEKDWLLDMLNSKYS